MESSSSPIGMIGGQRSNNTTPHHHYYSTPSTEQPSSFLSTHSYISGGAGDGRNSNPNRRGSGNGILSSHHGGVMAFPQGVIPSPLSHQNPSNRATPRSRGQSPSVNSLGAESNIIMDTMSSPPPTHPHLLPPHSLHHHHNHHLLNSVGHGHNHLHDDSHIHINCNNDNSSHSISPPNSNSNTTISCGSGNSTSANIGVPTSRDRKGGRGGSDRSNNLNNNNNINNNRHKSNKEQKGSEDYENYRNRTGSANKKGGLKGKKSILEDDFEKGAGDGTNNASKFRHNSPFINPNQEFLPICDALFNMISLAAYFCDVVFDVLTVYSWYKISIQTEQDFYELSHFQRNRLNPGGPSSQEVDERVSLMPRELMWQWSLLGLVFILVSCTLSQCLSFKWYKESERRGQKAPDGTDLEGPPPPCSSGTLVLMHMSLVGVLWRYFKLFIPVDLRFVKNEVRDLCLLRLIHAFCQAAPMLLLQLYLIWHEPGLDMVTDLTKVSTGLSLFSVCWALASFSKHIRRQNVHKLVLTWLGVIFQFFWRLGTVTSRFLALSLYAIAYQYWVFLVLFLHWFCMLLWLISPKNIFHGEKMSPLRKVSYSAIVAVVYTFCYINVQETNSRTKVIIYYVTMFLENSLLLGVWLIAVRYEDEIWFRSTVTWAVFLCFGGGLAFMALYYKYFHVKKLSYVYDAESSIYRNTSSIGGCSLINDNGSMVATISGSPGDYDGPARGKSNGVIIGYGNGRNGSLLGRESNKKKASTAILSRQSNRNCNNGGGGGGGGRQQQHPNRNSQDQHQGKKSDSNHDGVRSGGPLHNKMNGLHIHHPNIPGVFNCRFHPAMKRKKKKPTTFVPPPAVNTNNSTSSAAPHPPVTSSQTTGVNNSSNPENAGGMTLSTPNSNNVISSASPTTVTQLQNAAIEATIRHHENLVRSSPQQLMQYQEVGASSSPANNLGGGGHHHQHLHNHHLDYDNNSGSLAAHYDILEYNNGPAGMIVGGGSANESASSSYGPMMMIPGYPGMIKGSPSTTNNSVGRIMTPFWRRPLSLTMGSENEGSVSSRIDIQQKLQEKKQQQLAELREIEEEIKQGKLKRPELHEIIPQPVNVRQPIPIEKKQPWFGGSNGVGEDEGHHRPSMINHPSGDQEILLDPHQYLMYASSSGGPPPANLVPFIDTASGYYYNPEWPISPTMPNYYEPLYQNGGGDSACDDDIVGDRGVCDGGTSPPSGGASGDNGKGGRVCDRRRRKGRFGPSAGESIYKSYRIPSDIDSQMSLPRSYTLPREFKYKRKFRKPVKTENFLPSTNSSDGDVDSGEDPELYSEVHPYPLPLPSMHHIHHHNSNSTPSPTSGEGGVVPMPPTPIASSTPTPTSPTNEPPSSITHRQSRKIPNGRPRHKLHETKL